MAWNISFSAQELIFSCRKQINSWQFLDLKWSFLQCSDFHFFTFLVITTLPCILWDLTTQKMYLKKIHFSYLVQYLCFFSKICKIPEIFPNLFQGELSTNLNNIFRELSMIGSYADKK